MQNQIDGAAPKSATHNLAYDQRPGQMRAGYRNRF